MLLTREERSSWSKTYRTATIFTTNPTTRTSLKPNAGLRVEAKRCEESRYRRLC